MKNLTLDNLNIVIDKAIEVDAKYFGIAIDIGLDSREIVINSIDNMIDGKLSYYMKNYNEELELKSNPNIKISGFTFADNFADIEKDLLG